MLAEIRTAQPQLRPSERRVADAVLADPWQTLDNSVAELAARAGVSGPTVLRFCRALACDGYRSFRLALAHELGRRSGRQVRYVHSDLSADDPPGVLAGKVIDAAANGLLALKRQLDADALARAISLLTAARRLELYGLGGNAAVLGDAQLKFSRLGLAATAYSDAYLHRIAASLLDRRDVVIAISNTGRSTDLLASVDRARAVGARIIAITSAGSLLAAVADVVLAADSQPGAERDCYAPIRARLLPMVVVDILAIGVVFAHGPAAAGRLAALSEVLQDKFVP